MKESISYTAPEAIGLRWQKVAELLGCYLGDPSGTPWKEKVANIFNDKQ